MRVVYVALACATLITLASLAIAVPIGACAGNNGTAHVQPPTFNSCGGHLYSVNYGGSGTGDATQSNGCSPNTTTFTLYAECRRTSSNGLVVSNLSGSQVTCGAKGAPYSMYKTSSCLLNSGDQVYNVFTVEWFTASQLPQCQLTSVMPPPQATDTSTSVTVP